MKILKPIGCLTCLVLLFISAKGQPAKFQQNIDQYMNRYVSNGDFSGVVLVANADKIVFTKSYGKADAQLNIPMRENIKFRIASVSKTFTAAAITLLNNTGALSYSDKLSKYIPDFKNADSISLYHLLLHQAGVADIEYDKHVLDKLSNAEVINTLKDKPLYFRPGTQFRYSNSGYFLLATVIEKASGMTYEQFLTTHIFNKLGMYDTGIDHTGKLTDNMASGYSVGIDANGIAKASWYDINLYAGSGSIYSTANDLLKWLRAIKNNTLFNTQALPYPFGWGPREHFSGKKSIVQSGFLSGYSSYVSIYPTENLYFIALSNINSNFNEDAGKDLAAIYFNQPYALPDLRKEAILKDINAYVGKYSWPGYKEFYIEQIDNALYWRFTDEKTGSPLAPVSENAFLLRLMNSKIIFEKTQTGEVTALSFISGTNKTTCSRVK